MRRFAVCCVALAVAMLVWAETTQAQDQGQGRRGQRDSQRAQGGRQGRGAQGGGRGSLAGLVQMDAVKSEIDLTEDQGSEISEFVEGLEQPQFDFRGLRDASDEERAKMMAEMTEARAKTAAKIREKVEGTLLEPQMQRLNEIYVQALGINGLSDPWIAGQLDLNDDQKAKLAEMRPQFGRGGRGGRGGDAGGGQSREEREAAMLEVLTEEQQSKYEEMKGEEFEFPQRAGRGGRGGTGGGRGGAGGGGGGF